VSVYPFIEAEKAEQSEHVPSARELSDAELRELITKIHETRRVSCGAPRVRAELRRQEWRFKKTTIRNPLSEEQAVDLLRRAFGPGVRELDTACFGDISYVRTWEGWRR